MLRKKYTGTLAIAVGSLSSGTEILINIKSNTLMNGFIFFREIVIILVITVKVL